MAQNTPGPWETSVTADGTIWTVCEAGGGDLVASIANTGDDARLIAAAPDLLEALKECTSDEGALCWRNHDYAKRRLTAINEIVRAALAKAEAAR